MVNAVAGGDIWETCEMAGVVLLLLLLLLVEELGSNGVAVVVTVGWCCGCRGD